MGEVKEGFATLSVRVPPGAKAGQVLQLKTPDGKTLQCQVPPNLGVNGLFQVQYPIPLDIVDEAGRLASSQPLSITMPPSYWTNVKVPGNTAFDQMVYIDRAQHVAFQELLDESYFAKATRDRVCP